MIWASTAKSEAMTGEGAVQHRQVHNRTAVTQYAGYRSCHQVNLGIMLSKSTARQSMLYTCYQTQPRSAVMAGS